MATHEHADDSSSHYHERAHPRTDEDVFVAIDLGGTQLRTATFTQSGQLLQKWTTATPSTQGSAAVIDRIIACTRHAISTAHGPVRAVGMSCTGPIDPKTGTLRDAPTIEGFVDVPLGKILNESLHLPAEVINDANAATLAEWHVGSGQGVADYCYVTVSTGIGCGLISNGRLVTGGTGSAGELGRVRVAPMSGGGPRQSLEDLASGTAIAAHARRLVVEGAAPGIEEVAAGTPVTAETVCQAALSGDEIAQGIFRDATELLGEGLANLVRLFDPHLIAIGGGVTRAGDLFLEPLRAALAWSLSEDALDVPELVLASVPDDAALRGAAMWVIDKWSEGSEGRTGTPRSRHSEPQENSSAQLLLDRSHNELDGVF